ncbi:MAG: hypothetical protein HXX08_21615 [Chloroflexi bacterium]|uniref:Uncharacterized protein n=1 Tax=Candidatus Chlorohelix allophototropha TaxID=3003348 RepID=A0A8T7M8Y3_9CHLR|nr:hypothetical protein [Chloroflexota bacterium]WJW68396.1 hypothetical protein OZ401_004007 [Chloroflexota bacterium L227-S17]
MIHSFSIFLHYMGFLALAGGAIGSIIAVNTVWSLLCSSPSQALGVSRLIKRYEVLLHSGSVLLLVSETLVLVSSALSSDAFLQGVGGLLVYLLLFINGLFLAKPAWDKLAKLMPQWMMANGSIPSLMAAMEHTSTLYTKEEVETSLKRVSNRLELFQWSETILLFSMLVLIAL